MWGQRFLWSAVDRPPFDEAMLVVLFLLGILALALVCLWTLGGCMWTLLAFAGAMGTPSGRNQLSGNVAGGVLASYFLFAGWDKEAGVVALLPLWAAMAGVGLYRLLLLVLGRGR